MTKKRICLSFGHATQMKQALKTQVKVSQSMKRVTQSKSKYLRDQKTSIEDMLNI